MSDDANTPSEHEPKKKAGLAAMLTKLPVLIGGVMVIEAAVLLVGVKMLGGGPKDAEAAEVALDDHGNPIADTGHDKAAAGGLVEVAVVALRAPNLLNGRTYLYDVEITIRVQADSKEQVEKRLSNSTALVRDRMNGIIGQIDPQKLNGALEPGLETLRRQVKYQLDLIVGEGLIEEVLVPRCIPYRTDY